MLRIDRWNARISVRITDPSNPAEDLVELYVGKVRLGRQLSARKAAQILGEAVVAAMQADGALRVGLPESAAITMPWTPQQANHQAPTALGGLGQPPARRSPPPPPGSPDAWAQAAAMARRYTR